MRGEGIVGRRVRPLKVNCPTCYSMIHYHLCQVNVIVHTKLQFWFLNAHIHRCGNTSSSTSFIDYNV